LLSADEYADEAIDDDGVNSAARICGWDLLNPPRDDALDEAVLVDAGGRSTADTSSGIYNHACNGSID
jgi:hypothetical protein